MARPKQGWKLRKHWKLYYVRFTHDGQRVELPTGSTDPEEAAKRAAKIYAEHHLGRRRARVKASDPNVPIMEVAALWLVDVERELGEATVDTMMVYVRHFAEFFGTVGALVDVACARYARERLGRVKRATVQKELSALRRFLTWCVEHEVLSRAPAVPSPPRRSLGKPFEKRRRSKATPLTPDEALAIIAALPEWSKSGKVTPFVVRARFRLAWETALRPNTISLLSVPENYVRGSSVLVITDEIDKARFGREVPLTDDAKAALESVCPSAGIIFGRHDYRDQLKRAAASVLPPERARTFTAYDLRHARATQWAESGNLVGVAYLLGHKQITTTNKYAKPNRAAAERVLGVKDSAVLLFARRGFTREVPTWTAQAA
jgi:integrase